MTECDLCDGGGVLYILDWAHAREDGRALDWHENETYPTWCHGCPAGLTRRAAGLL